MQTDGTTTRWIRLVLAAALAIAAGLAIVPGQHSSTAEATNPGFVPTTGFEVDGNLPYDSVETGDWLAPYGAGTTPDGYPTTGVYYVNENDDPCFSTSDDQGGNTSVTGKVEDGPAWPADPSPSSAPAGKTDLDSIWFGAEKVNVNPADPEGQINDILYVAYETCLKGSSGSFATLLYLDDGDGLLPSDGDLGDFLFRFDFNPNQGTVASQFFRRTSTTSWGSAVPFPATAIDTAIGGGGDLGEVALNLTALGIIGEDECKTIEVTGQGATIAGGSFSSAVKDLVEVEPFQISNCGALTVDKVSDPAGISSTALFTYDVEQIDDRPVHAIPGSPVGDLDTTGVNSTGEPDGDVTEIDATIQVGQQDLWVNLISEPDYTIVERMPLEPGWELQRIECVTVDLFAAGFPATEPIVIYDGAPTGNTFLIPPDVIETTAGVVDLPPASCTITNATSGVIVSKTGSGDGTTSFSFDVFDNDAGATLASPSLTLEASSDVIAATPGSSVTITETGPLSTPAWSLTSVVCSYDPIDDDPDVGEIEVWNSATDGLTPTFDTIAGEVVTCTFTNDQQARILVEKVGRPDPDLAGVAFGFETDIDGETAAPADFTLQIGDTVANGTNYDSLDIPPGAYTVTELIGDAVAEPAFELFGVTCVDDTAGSNGSTSSAIADGASVDLAAGDVVTCTFDNRQLGRIVIEKTTDGGDDTFEFTGPGALTGSITTSGGTGPTLSADVVAGSYRIDETPTPGYTLDSVNCVDPTGGTVADASGATVDVAAGDIVTCTFDNVRNSAQFTLAKEWVEAIDGDTVTLAANGSDDNAEEIAGVLSVAPASNQGSMTVYSGEIIDFSETFGPGVDANYIVTLVCRDANGEIISNTGATSGQLVVPDEPSDITCTFTNTRRSTSLLLQKEWVDGRSSDTAALTAGTATATSTATGAAGSEIDGTNQAVLTTVFVGDSIDLSEVLSAEDLYTTELACVGGDLTYTSGDRSGAVEVLVGDEGQQIECTFTNTRKSVTVEVTKDWASSPSSADALDLEIGPDGAELGTGSSAVAGTTTNATAVVLVGETYDIREVFTSGDAANYDIDWSCDNVAADAGTGTTGTVTVAGTDADVLCTFVNDRLSTTLSLEKAWENGAPGDTSGLTVSPVLSPATGPVVAGVPAGGTGAGTAAVDAVTVYAGDDVTLSEAFGAGNVGSYDVTDFSCTGSVNASSGWTGADDLDAVLTIDPADTSAITCTVTNARRSATLTLAKTWSDPVGGVGLTIDAAGDDANVGDTISEATTSPTGTSGTMTIYSGETITLSETFTADPADLDLFTSTLDCGAGELGVTEEVDGTWTTTIDAGADPVDTTCTFDNVRNSTTLELYKSWVNGTSTDSYELSIAGTDSPDVVTDDSIVAQAPDGSGQSAEFATLVVYAGESVELSEVASAGNVGTYTVADLDCTAGLVGWTSGGLSGTVAIGAADIATDPIVCEFANERTSAELTLQKAWVNAAAGDTTDLDITSVLDQSPLDGATSTVSGDPGTIATETDTTNVVTATVLSGEVVTLDEVLGGSNVGTYTSEISCDQPVLAVDPTAGASGDFTVASTPVDTTCTFTNTRTSTTLIVEKEWVDGESGDTAEITVTSDLGGGTATSTSTGQAGSEVDTPVVTTTVLSGEAVIIDEVLGDTNLATYASSLDCGAGVIGTTSGQIIVPPTDGDITCRFLNEAGRGNITIVKSVNGADGTFDFNADWVDPETGEPVGDVQLTTDGGTVSQTWTGVIVPSDGSPFTIVETDPGSAYDFTSLECVESGAGADNGSSSDGLTGTIDLDVGETVTCTYTNTQRSTLIVVKDAVPDDDQDFSFTTTESGPADQLADSFTLDDDAGFAASPDPDTLDNTFTSALLSAGDAFTYSVAETAVDGWVNTSATCDNGDTPDAITLAPGTTVTCTFVNDADEGSVSVTKTVEGLADDVPWSFDIAISPVDPGVTSPQTISGVGNGTGDSPVTFEPLTLNSTYTILEPAIPAGWEQTFTGCSVPDADDATDGYQVTITEPNQAITCDITNTALPGALTISKLITGDIDPTLGWAFSFTIAPEGNPAGAQEITGTGTTPDGTVSFDQLVPGTTYTVTEADVPGWQLNGVICTVTPADPATAPVVTTDGTFTVTPGASVGCDFDNSVNPSEVRVTKVVDGGLDAAQDWAFEFTLTPDANPIGSQTASGTGDGSDAVTWTNLVPGTEYVLAEVLPGTNTTTYANGVLTCTGAVDTDDDDQTVTFTAPLGGAAVEVDCSVTNTAQSDVSFAKVVDSVSRDADSGVWTITYLVDVVNADDAGVGVYDLTDEFDFGAGVTIVDGSASVTNTEPGTITTNAAFDGVGDTTVVTAESIAPTSTHTYLVSVDVTIAVGPGTDGDCISVEGEGTGFLNTAQLAVDGGEPVTTDACAGFAQLTLVKDVVNDDGGNATVADFPLTAEGPAALSGVSGTSDVSSAVPAGSYAIAEDELVEGYTDAGFVCEGATDSSTSSVLLSDGDDATCTIVNDDEPIDLELTKDDGGAEAVAGGAPFDYTISVQNVGTRDLDLGEPVTVTDVLPAGLSWVSFPATCSQAGQTLTCDVDPAALPAGGDPVVITATVRAPAGAASGTYVNRASVTTEDDTTTNPPCPALGDNNVDCEDTPVDREGGVRITKTDDVADGASVQPGDTFTYRLVVTNTGVSTLLPGTHVEDDLPAQLEFVSAVGGAGWTCNDSDPIDCDYAPTLAPGASAPAIVVTVSVAEDASGETIENVAVVRAAVDRDCPSALDRLTERFEPACNEVTDDDDEITPLSANADLAIVKTASVELIGAGGGFDWVLDITNNGPGTAVDVVIGDLVPPAVVVTGVSSDDFDCGNDGNTVSCTVASLAVGESGTVTITVSVPLTAPGGDVVNVGTVESATPDPDLSNNSDEASVTVVAIAPPTTTLPPVTLPPTGSNGTDPLTKAGIVFLVLGAGFILITRRRRDDVTVG